MEQWRQIGDTRYEVSNLGRIKDSTRGNILKGSGHNKGYRSVCLRINNRDSIQLVHRLVAKAFISNEDLDRDCVNHKDGDKLNNKVSNLEWCTKAENNKHAYSTGLRKGGSGNYVTEDQVRESRKLYEKGWKVSEISKHFSLDWNIIDNIIKRRTYKNL